MAYHIGVIIFAILLFVFTVIAFNYSFTVFWRHRTDPNIAARHPWITISVYFIFLHFIVLNWLPTLLRFSYYPCIITVYEQSLSLFLLIGIVGVRLIMLYFDFKLTDEKNEARKGWFLRHKKYFEPTVLLPIMFIIVIAFAIPDWLVFTVVSPEAISVHFMDKECFDAKLDGIMFLALVARYSFAIIYYVALYLLLRNWTEAFLIKQELFYLILVSCAMMIPWLVASYVAMDVINPFNDEIFPILDWIPPTYALLVSVVFFVYPTWAFKKTSQETLRFLNVWKSTRKLSSYSGSSKKLTEDEPLKASKPPLHLESFLSIPEFAEALRKQLMKEFCVENISYLFLSSSLTDLFLAILKMKNKFLPLLSDEEKISVKSPRVSITITDNQQLAVLENEALAASEERSISLSNLGQVSVHKNSFSFLFFSHTVIARRSSADVVSALTPKPDSGENHQIVLEIIESFLTRDALLEVNVSQESFINTRAALANLVELEDEDFGKKVLIEDIFGDTYKQVFDMVKFGAYSRLIDSDEYNPLVENYEALNGSLPPNMMYM